MSKPPPEQDPVAPIGADPSFARGQAAHCPKCGEGFLPQAAFCRSCGVPRPTAPAARVRDRRRVGAAIASLIALVVVGGVVGSLLMTHHDKAASSASALTDQARVLTPTPAKSSSPTITESTSTNGALTTAGVKKIAKIGVMAPLSGDLSSYGLGIQHSVELAVKQANDNNAIPGWTLEVEAKDDEAKPDVGKNVATAFVGDPDIAGVVGSLNASVAQSTQPVLATAKIVQVSPANTNPTLTRGANFMTAPARTYSTYFRTCAMDAYQGPFAARYLFRRLGMTKVATIHDQTTYGRGLVDAFTTEFKKLGGSIVDAEMINPDDSSYQVVISKVKPAAPEAVYFGGVYPNGGPLSQAMKAAGLNVPLVGGDGIYDPLYIQLGDASSAGDLATVIGAPTDQISAGKTFLADYAAAGYNEPAAAYGAYSFDAANAIINALKVSLKGAEDVGSVRQATIDALGALSFDGVTGKVAFDQYGDTKTRMLTVYRVADGKWGPVDTEEFK